MYWTDTPDGHRCTRHDVEFLRGEVCQKCVDDPGDAPGTLPDEDVSDLRGRIGEYRSNYRSCIRRSKSLADEGTAKDGGLAVKWNDCAIKWARLAEEQQSILDDREHNLKLIRHEQEMSGLRGSH